MLCRRTGCVTVRQSWQDMHRFDITGSITREQNVFTAQKTPLFIRTDVVNKLQACFPQNKILVQNTLISMRWRRRDKSWGTVCKVRNAKHVTNKILNTFTVTHCSVTKFSSHVTALLLVILQQLFVFLWFFIMKNC